MNKIYMRLPRDGYETLFFQGIVSLVSVNIIVPIIVMQRERFSWNHYFGILKVIPFMWLAVVLSIIISQWPANKLKNALSSVDDSFNAQVLVNVFSHVLIISALMTVLSNWIINSSVELAPFYYLAS